MLLVKDLMSREVLTVSPEDFPKDAFEKLKQHHLNHLMVVNDQGQVVGMLSTWDFRPIINYLASGDLKSTNMSHVQLYNVGRVRDLMTPDPLFVSPELEVSEAARLMLEKNIHSLPVGSSQKLEGIITHRDMLRAIAKQMLHAH